jgi:hypothetical protein
MTRRVAITFLFLLSFTFNSLLGDEPSWTPEERERAKQRDAVVTAAVTKVVDLGQVDPYSRLISAELKIERTQKPHSELKTDALTIYYLGSHNGAKRCPNYAALEVGMTGDFYLCRGDWLTKKVDFILSMGSDFMANGSVTPQSGTAAPSKK